MLINTILIIVGFLDVVSVILSSFFSPKSVLQVFSIPSVIVCLRELCDCYNPALLAPPPRKDWRLLSWLGHQSAPVFYSPSSGVPYTKLPPGAAPRSTVLCCTLLSRLALPLLPPLPALHQTSLRAPLLQRPRQQVLHGHKY